MKLIIFGTLAVAVGVSFSGCTRSENAQDKAWASCNMLLNFASQGCDGFKKIRGSWPNSIEEIASFHDDLSHKDAWGHDFGFTAFDPAKGFGEVISYGRDGKPGGAGEDSDIDIRFPVNGNADWNRQQAMSVKVPKGGDTNWYEFYIH